MPRKAIERAQPSSFGAQIKAMREAAGLSQTEVGKLAGIDQRQVSRYETGRQDLTVGRLEQILAVLGAHLEIRG